MARLAKGGRDAESVIGYGNGTAASRGVCYTQVAILRTIDGQCGTAPVDMRLISRSKGEYSRYAE